MKKHFREALLYTLFLFRAFTSGEQEPGERRANDLVGSEVPVQSDFREIPADAVVIFAYHHGAIPKQRHGLRVTVWRYSDRKSGCAASMPGKLHDKFPHAVNGRFKRTAEGFSDAPVLDFPGSRQPTISAAGSYSSGTSIMCGARSNRV